MQKSPLVGSNAVAMDVEPDHLLSLETWEPEIVPGRERLAYKTETATALVGEGGGSCHHLAAKHAVPTMPASP